MRLLAGVLAIALAMIMIAPVGAVETIFEAKLDDDAPPFYDDGYALDQNFQLSRTVMILDASIDKQAESYKDKYIWGGIAIIAVGLCIVFIPPVGTIAGLALIIGGILVVASTLLRGGQSITVEAYDGSNGELDPIPNVIPIVNGGANGLLGSWGFNDARTGENVRLITNDEGKTSKVVADGYTFFATPHFRITYDDAATDPRFTSGSPNARTVQQFVMNESTTHGTHDFDDLTRLLADKHVITSLGYMTDAELEDAYNMDRMSNVLGGAVKSPWIMEAPGSLLDASHIVEYKVIFILYRKSAEYRNMTDEAVRIKGVSDIQYLPRISETCDYYLNTGVQGEMMPIDDIKGSGVQPLSTQDTAYGFVDYMVDVGNNHVHPLSQISASNSMAYAIIWGRYEGMALDGMMTTHWARYHIAVHDNDFDIDYHAVPVAVCIDNSNVQEIGGYPTAQQAYVVVLLNFTPVARGSAFGRSLEINAQLKEISAVRYHTFWRDNVSIHPIKLQPDMVGQAGKLGDYQPFNKFLSDWIDYETWDARPSPYRRYVTLRGNDEWIPLSFCVAYIDQSFLKATLTFYLCSNGGEGFNVKSNAMSWTVHDVTANITVSGVNTTVLIENFGDDTVHNGNKYSKTFNTPSGEKRPLIVNITLNATFYWDSGISGHGLSLHPVNITAFGMFPIQENYDNFMGTFETNVAVLEKAMSSYPISQTSLRTIKEMITTYCDARSYIQSEIDGVKEKAENKHSTLARVEVEIAESYFGGISEKEKSQGYLGTCEQQWRSHLDAMTDTTDPYTVGGHIHVAYSLIIRHYCIFEQLNKAMLYINSHGNVTKYQYAQYAKEIKDKITIDPPPDDGDYNKKIDWSLVVAVIAIILAIISTILLYKLSKEKNIIPSNWMNGWRFAVVIVAFCGIACVLYLVYWNVGLMVAHNLNAYTSIRGWFS